jgi:tellurite resistance protein TehA-like permease
MKNFAPAYFALVMATGIVSIAAWNYKLSVLSAGLFAFNLVAFGALAAFTAMRALRYPRLFLADLTDHRVAPGFFAIVAASSIVGTQFFLLDHNHVAAGVFLGLGAILWLGVNYAVFFCPYRQAGQAISRPSRHWGLAGRRGRDPIGRRTGRARGARHDAAA